MTAATAGLAAVTLSFVLAGCDSDSTSETPAPATTTTAEALAPAEIDEPNDTLHDYIVDNDITEVPFEPGDPGSPDFDFPFPEGWSDAPEIPEWAYGAIVYDTPDNPADPPSIIATGSKLTGNVDPARVLEYAAGELRNLPEFEPSGDPDPTDLGGFDAVEFAGSYVNDGTARTISQETVVVPVNDAFYIVQLEATALAGQADVIRDAMRVINEQTTITAQP